MVVLQYPGPNPSRRGGVFFPHAQIRVERHTDGRFMWAHSFSTSQGGEGYAPLPKWGNFASTEREAIEAAVAELLERLDQRSWRDNAQARDLRTWAEEVRAPVQGGLFA